MPNFMAGLQNHKLSRIVMPGAHDAGIYGNHFSRVALTQALDIRGQINCGVRWFDIRVQGELVDGVVQHKAYHGKGARERNQDGLDYLKGGFGGFGGEIGRMTRDAIYFLRQPINQSEVLIFKISKSSNIETVFNAICDAGGDVIYSSRDHFHNLNQKTVGELRGSLIILVEEKHMPALRGSANSDKAFSFKELYAGGAVYENDYRGLQYYGKHSGTNYKALNRSTQKKRISKGNDRYARTEPEAMGMLYWTLTTAQPLALPISIKNRDKLLWKDRYKAKLQTIWKNGLEDSLRQRIGHGFNLDVANHEINLFMPNIIMVDFADASKCRTIIDLNQVPNAVLNEMRLKRDDPADGALQQA